MADVRVVGTPDDTLCTSCDTVRKRIADEVKRRTF